jgi:hypothetical protein
MQRIIRIVKWQIARFERFWNNNPYLAMVLIAIAAGAAIWTKLNPQSPGFSITLLALGAGIISVRPNMHLIEKFAWVIVLATFTYQEVKAIKQNDLNNQAIRTSQNAAFGVIVDDLKTSIKNSKDQYKQTIDRVNRVSDHVDGAAKKTQQVAEIARTNLLTITGGDSYAFVYPDAIAGSDQQLLKIHNPGDQPLTDVRVTVGEIVVERAADDCDDGLQGHDVIQIGTLAPHEGRIIQGAVFVPHLRPDGTARYQLWITAQNGGVS